jgi:hypothetical protein
MRFDGIGDVAKEIINLMDIIGLSLGGDFPGTNLYDFM